MEVDIDSYRTGLLTLFNTDFLSSTNFSGSMALAASKFTGTNLLSADNTDIDFGNADNGFWGLDSSKRMYWNTTSTSTKIRFYAGTTYYMEFTSTLLNVPGDIVISNRLGGTNTVLQAVSSYKKPTIVWNSTSSIRLQNNNGTTDSSTVYFPTFAISVTEASPTKYRHASIASTANGYGAADSGSALGGIRSGLTLTTNNWYYVYCAKVRSGTDFSATAAKFIMVFDQTSPDASNKSTLDTRYGDGCYVYLGMVRYGYGATGASGEIIKFTYSSRGLCSFQTAGSSGYGGLNLAYTTTDADNTASAFYTIANGVSGNVIPAHISFVTLSLNRERVSKWYIKDTSGDVVWDGGWQDDAATLPHGFMVTLANDTGYGVYQLRKSSNAGTAKAVTLQSFMDTARAVRRHGHGV